MTVQTAITGARIFDGDKWHEEQALLVEDGKIAGLSRRHEVPSGIRAVAADGLLLVPGFIDLQVNGGGGVLLNEKPDAAGIATICAAHARFGTTALLPTLITDTREVTAAALAAGRQAKAAKVPGFLGLHIEGPHLSLARKGVHDPALIRPMEKADLDALLACADTFDAMMVTVAPESVTMEQIKALSKAGIIVSLGHSDESYDTMVTATEAGASTVTHLFNAMSPLGHRQPGLVGAALELGHLNAGMIADGFHVDIVAMRIALRAKKGPGRIFLVTDAMSTIGSDMTEFTLNGRRIFRRDGKLTLADGTLAGADIDMMSSIRFIREKVGLPLEEALRMASTYPADACGIAGRKGRITHGHDADFVLVTPDLEVKATYIAGRCVFEAA